MDGKVVNWKLEMKFVLILNVVHDKRIFDFTGVYLESFRAVYMQ